MLQKLKKQVRNNLGLKALSVVIAVMVWMLVVNFDDPEKSVTYTIAVDLVGQEELLESGKVCEISDDNSISNGSVMATFRVTGKRSVLDKLSSSDFTATADLTQAFDLGSDSTEKYVPVTVSAKSNQSEITISQRTVNIKVVIEDIKEKTCYVNLSTQGEVSTGYALGTLSSSTTRITVSGPDSVVSTISKAVAILDVEGATEDRSEDVYIILYDAEGNEIEDTRLTLSESTVTLTAQVLATKTVSVVYDLTEEVAIGAAEGFIIASVTATPDTVTVKGRAEALSELTEIVIDASAVNLSGLSSSTEKSVTITGYLPDGVSLVSSEEAIVSLAVDVEALATTNLLLSTNGITVENLGQGLELSFSSSAISVEVEGSSATISGLSTDSLKATVDAEGLSAGSYDLPVTVTCTKSGCWIAETITVHVVISEAEATGDHN